MGQTRRIPKSKSDKLMRELKAMLLQQVESDLLKVSLVRLCKKTKRKGLDASIVACIHDPIWVEAPSAEQGDVGELMRTAMTAAELLRVPMEVDFE